MANGEIIDYGQLSASGAAEHLKDTAAVRQTMQLATQAVEQALERQDQQFSGTYQNYKEPAQERFARIHIDGKSVDQLLEERFPNANLDVHHRKQMGLLLVARAQIEGKPVQVSPFADELGSEAVALGATGLSSELVKPIKLTGWQAFWAKIGFYKKEAAAVHAANEKHSERFDRLEATTLASNIHSSQIRQDNERLIATQTPVIQQMFSSIQNTQQELNRQFVAGVERSCFIKPEYQTGEKQAVTMSSVQHGGPMRERFMPKIALLMMLDKGYTLEEAVDPTKHVEVRAEIGKELGKWGKECASQDPAIYKPAQERYDEFLLRVSQKLLDQKAPSQEEMRTMKNPNLLYIMGYLGFDCFQELNYISPERKEHPRFELMRQSMVNLGGMGVLGTISESLKDSEKWVLPAENASAEVQAERTEQLAEQTKEFLIMNAHAIAIAPESGETLQELVEKNPEAGARNNNLKQHYEGMLEQLDGPDRPVASLRDIQTGKVEIEPIIRNYQDYAESVDSAGRREVAGGTALDRRAKITLAESLVQKLGVDPVKAKAQFDKCTTEMFNNPSFEKLVANQAPEKLLALSQNPEALDKILPGIKPKISVNSVEKAVSMNKELQAQPKHQPKPQVLG